jgi:hypothetical protein
MKTDDVLLYGVVAFLLFKITNRPMVATSPTPLPPISRPVNVAPQPVNAVPPSGSTVNAPVDTVTGTGLQMCVAPDGNTYFWKSSQGCPYADFAVSGVPYTIGADGTPIPLTY